MFDVDEFVDLTEKYNTRVDYDIDKLSEYYSKFPAHKYKIFDENMKEFSLRNCFSCKELQNELERLHNIYCEVAYDFIVFDCNNKEYYNFKDVYGCHGTLNTCFNDCYLCRKLKK